MKRELILTVLGAAAAAMTISATPKNDELTARWAKVNAVAVYFNPAPDGQKWVNKRLSDVVTADGIAKLILIEAMTSAPPDIDSLAVFTRFQNNATFYQRDGAYAKIVILYRAIIFTKDNRVFQVEIGTDPDRKELARLISESGEYGYFK